MAAAAYIYDTKTLHVIAHYDNTLIAHRMLENAKTKGHKLNGRKFSGDWLERMEVTTVENFRTNIDHHITVKNLMSGQPVTIWASQKGMAAFDPSMEGYWSL